MSSRSKRFVLSIFANPYGDAEPLRQRNFHLTEKQRKRRERAESNTRSNRITAGEKGSIEFHQCIREGTRDFRVCDEFEV